MVLGRLLCSSEDPALGWHRAQRRPSSLSGHSLELQRPSSDAQTLPTPQEAGPLLDSAQSPVSCWPLTTPFCPKPHRLALGSPGHSWGGGEGRSFSFVVISMVPTVSSLQQAPPPHSHWKPLRLHLLGGFTDESH